METWWDPNRIVAADLFSVASLSLPNFANIATVSTILSELDNDYSFARQCLTSECRSHIHCALALIPEYASIFDADVQHNLDIANDIWGLIRASPALRATKCFGPTGLSKLLARKRPHLVPILDEVARTRNERAHGSTPACHWCSMRSEFNGSKRLTADLAIVRGAAGLPPWVSLLRIIDIVVWMKDTGAACLPTNPW
jgi:hypothetical protein